MFFFLGSFFFLMMTLFYAAVPNHRSWSPRSDVAGFMDVMQTKGSRQISRVPSEDAVAPTSG